MTLPSSFIGQRHVLKSLIQVWQMVRKLLYFFQDHLNSLGLQQIPLYFRELIKPNSPQLAAEAKEWIIRFQERIHHR